jgi:hypothetical protein
MRSLSSTIASEKVLRRVPVVQVTKKKIYKSSISKVKQKVKEASKAARLSSPSSPQQSPLKGCSDACLWSLSPTIGGKAL